MNIIYFRPKLSNEFQSNFNGKSNGNSFKESMKSRTHLGFGGDGKYYQYKYIFFIYIYIYIIIACI